MLQKVTKNFRPTNMVVAVRKKQVSPCQTHQSTETNRVLSCACHWWDGDSTSKLVGSIPNKFRHPRATGGTELVAVRPALLAGGKPNEFRCGTETNQALSCPPPCCKAESSLPQALQHWWHGNHLNSSPGSALVGRNQTTSVPPQLMGG